jgi:hypothetical protein
MTDHTVSPQQLEALIKAIQSPNYSHARTRYFMGDGTTYLYDFDPLSPSGVMCKGSGPSGIVDPLIMALRSNSPLSPTEGLNKSRVSSYA